METKKLLSFFLITFFVFGVASQCFAITIPNPIKAGSIPELIKTIVDLIFYIAVAVVPLMVVIGGIMFMMAAGEPQKVSKAKNVLLWSIVGMAVILLSRAIGALIGDIVNM